MSAVAGDCGDDPRWIHLANAGIARGDVEVVRSIYKDAAGRTDIGAGGRAAVTLKAVGSAAGHRGDDPCKIG